MPALANYAVSRGDGQPLHRFDENVRSPRPRSTRSHPPSSRRGGVGERYL